MAFCSWWALRACFLLVLSVASARNIGRFDRLGQEKVIEDATLKTLLEELAQILDPVYVLPRYSVSTNGEFGNIQLAANDTQFCGFNDFTVLKAHVIDEPLSFEVGIEFRNVSSSGLYNLFLDDYLFKLRGHGNFSVISGNISLFLNVTFSTNSNNKMEIKTFASDYRVPFVQVNFQNLGEDDDVSGFINDFLDRFIPMGLISLKPTVQKFIQDQLTPIGNFAVANLTLSEFKDYINSLV